MDNKQAIQELKNIKKSKETYVTKVFGCAYKDEICALEIAIKALENIEDLEINLNGKIISEKVLNK